MTLTKGQLEMRRTGISASDVSSILNLNPYRRPIDVWRDKTNPEPVEVRPETEQQALGHVFEVYLSKQYCKQAPEEMYRRAYEPKKTLRHPVIDWVFATPDRFVFEIPQVDRKSLPLGLKDLAETGKASHLLEVKLVGPFAIRNWIADVSETEEGLEEADRVPMYVFCQCQWQMLVTGYRRVDIVALLGGTKLRVFTIPYDTDFVADALAVCGDFRKKYILTGVEPPADGSKQYRAYLNERYPGALNDSLVEAPRHVEPIAFKYKELGNKIKELGTEKEKLSQIMKELIGANDGIVGEWGKATWRLGRGRVDYTKLISDLGLKDSELNKYRTPSRTFRLNIRKPQ